MVLIYIFFKKLLFFVNLSQKFARLESLPY